ncbi:MAG TPA: S41 family peptidase [Firmicutes bacterium]|nr:S41 family peptidase [Bacillota bacterium]
MNLNRRDGARRLYSLGSVLALALVFCTAVISVVATRANPWDKGSAGHPASHAVAAAESSDKTALEVVWYLQRFYIEKVDTAKLLSTYMKRHSIPDMLEILKDPYTRYMNPAEFATMQENMKGEFEGIGITVGIRDNKLTVVAPLEGTPGYRAGIKPGDHIVTIDGRPTKDMALDYAVSLMRGKKGTTVTLGIERNNCKELLDFKIVRDVIKAPPPVEAKMLDGKIGYLILGAFMGEDTADAMRRSLEELSARGMQGLILDLRYNGGGLLDLAIKIAGLFVPEGKPIVYTVSRDGSKHAAYAGPGKRFTMPMVVLVNEYTASASEILSGALQDLEIAELVGVKTFGKGVVQQIFPLSDGSAVTITISKYLTPNGRSIHGKGIEPDVVVELPHTEASAEKAADKDPEAGDKVTQVKDVQLEKAKAVLLKRIEANKAKEVTRSRQAA